MGHLIRVTGKAWHFECEPHETVLEAAQRQKIKVRAACTNGVCHVCRAQLVSGHIQEGPMTKTDNLILLCNARPQSECEIYVKHIFGPGEFPLKELYCQIKSVRHLQANVYAILLEAPAGKTPEFSGGQYLSMHFPDREEPAFFSIASAPGQREIELHIYADPNIQNAQDTVEFLQNNEGVKVSLPFGKACLEHCVEDEAPLLLIAAGTGFAQMKAIVESIKNGRETKLLWGARNTDEVYAKTLAKDWAKTYPWFDFKVVSADASASDEESPHHEALEAAVRAIDFEWKNINAFISGSPKLVFRLMDALEALGTPTEHIMSDVLEYCERPSD